ncbi:hypothetical protein [Acetobacterium sp. K1/6]|jgi:predicted component of type VI protein secretion system|uniref:hypothetical protein n=2 Tax=Eubacteriaceae TaxID=186806 RepID=UPI002ACA914B|nr:hypothetical protein [Acetobacterium sp. K1/6]MDZ5726771.1 hypothetical protein [Acetobacterium sp. K1/6]
MKKRLFAFVAIVLLIGVLTGCEKDEILEAYNYAIQTAGDYIVVAGQIQIELDQIR